MYDEKQLLKPGVYSFIISYCNVDYISKASNSSIKLSFDIVDSDGANYTVHDYLTKKNDEKTGKPFVFIVKKIAALLSSIGKPGLIGKVLKNEDLLGATGFASVSIIDDNIYGKQNKINRFISGDDAKNHLIANEVSSRQIELPLDNLVPVSAEVKEPFDDIPF
jgi:hypothetical protein